MTYWLSSRGNIMATIIILAIDDDNLARAYELDIPCHVAIPWKVNALTPVRSGDDRGHYYVFEVAGASIDVMRVTRTNPKED